VPCVGALLTWVQALAQAIARRKCNEQQGFCASRRRPTVRKRNKIAPYAAWADRACGASSRAHFRVPASARPATPPDRRQSGERLPDPGPSYATAEHGGDAA